MTFSPTDYGTDLVCWYDFTDTNHLTIVSNKVSAVADLSGNAHHLAQSTAASRPVVVTGIWPNSAVRTLFTVGCYMDSPALGATVSQPFTWFFAFAFGPHVGTSETLIADSDGSVLIMTSGNLYAINAGNGDTSFGFTPTSGAPAMFSAILNGTSSKQRLNGVSSSTHNPGSNGYGSTNKFRFAARSNFTGTCNLMPLEAFCVKGAIEGGAPEDYLTAKWATNGAISGVGYVAVAFEFTEGTTLTSFSSSDASSWQQRTPVSGGRDGTILDNRTVDGYWYLALQFDPYNTATTFPIYRSSDYVGWTKVTDVDCSAVLTGDPRVWRGTWFVDDDGSVHYFAALGNTPAPSVFDMSIYEIHPTNAGFTTWSAPVVISGTGLPSNMIDCMVFKDGSTYHAFFKNDTTKVVEWISSSSLLTGWTMSGTGNWAGWGSSTEGSCVRKIGHTWYHWFYQYELPASTRVSTASAVAGPWSAPADWVPTNAPNQDWANVWVNPLISIVEGSGSVAGSGAISVDGNVRIVDPLPAEPWSGPHHTRHSVDARRSYRRRQ